MLVPWRRAWRRVLGPVLALLFVSSPAAGLQVEPLDAPTEFVTDRAEVLGEDVEEQLNAQLEAFEAETSNQVVVYVDSRLPDDREIEELAADAFQAWGIGQADRDNGVLFMVFTEERKARIEVGYGLEGALPDALAGQILAEQAIPHFRNGQWATGITNAVDGIIAATRGEYEGTGESDAGAEEDGGWEAFLSILGIYLLFQLLRWIWWRMRQSRRGLLGRTIGPTGWMSTYFPVSSSSGGFSSGGGGFSGGGFSGGGGSSGGGGASGSW